MREDTRTRIQEIALRLFIEQGYEATSLREIAEELGVTKAALYYHFKTKDDIVASLVEKRQVQVEELLAWLKTQPKTPETRRELVLRYADMVPGSEHSDVAQFLERNQTALRDHPTLVRIREVMMELVGELTSPGDPLETRVSRSMALFALHASKWFPRNEDLAEAEVRDAAVKVALRLLEP
ncbi:MAG: TetR/AcrR family transcriptional regulator [Nonomuraea sp.]|nr:TetR/AcrR family transcriptional regulator [Nonomuraea sp.]